MPGHRIFTTPVASVHPHYVAKAERKGRTRDEVDEVICWLTGYDAAGLAAALEEQVDFETFFDRAPAMTPHAALITGSICGVRVEEVEDPLMRKIRLLDELVDEIAEGRPMSKVLRGADAEASRRADDAALLEIRPDLGVEVGTVLDDLDSARSER